MIPISKPTVGSDNGTWGDELNAALDALNAADYFKVKTAGQTVSASTTLVDDTHMAGIVLPVGTFVINASYLVDGPSAADVKIAWAFSGSNSFATRAGDGPASSTTTALLSTVSRSAAAGDTAATITTAVPYGTDGTNWSFIQETGVIVVTVSGTLKVQWAQLASSGSTAMHTGSFIWARQVA